MKYNFIRTTDKKIFEILKKQGFQLVDDNNGFFTFLNDRPLMFSDEADVSKVHYTNTLCI